MKTRSTAADKTVIKKHIPFLRTLSRVGKKRRVSALKTAPASLFTAIKKLCKLLVKGDIALSDKHRKKLKPAMKNILRRIHAAKNPRQVVMQNGTGFAGILKALLPVIADFFL